MMFITRQQVEKLERKYGKPVEATQRVEISLPELELIKSSQKKHNRAHDVTMFIFNSRNELAMIAKHFYPPGAYRPPSGGINPGEEMEAGILREAKEETGLPIKLERFILLNRVIFTAGEAQIPWTTYVFSARGEGPLIPEDTKEISGAKWGTIQELNTSIKDIFLSLDAKLFKYRVDLHQTVASLIEGKDNIVQEII